ncbi:hypothetical protein Tco_0673558 [Tanacetum coccineum]
MKTRTQKKEEFEEEEEPQEEEDDMEVDIEEDENEPELTYPYEENLIERSRMRTVDAWRSIEVVECKKIEEGNLKSKFRIFPSYAETTTSYREILLGLEFEAHEFLQEIIHCFLCDVTESCTQSLRPLTQSCYSSIMIKESINAVIAAKRARHANARMVDLEELLNYEDGFEKLRVFLEINECIGVAPMGLETMNQMPWTEMKHEMQSLSDRRRIQKMEQNMDYYKGTGMDRHKANGIATVKNVATVQMLTILIVMIVVRQGHTGQPYAKDGLMQIGELSFVDTRFSSMLNIDLVKIGASYEVELADGRVLPRFGGLRIGYAWMSHKSSILSSGIETRRFQDLKSLYCRQKSYADRRTKPLEFEVGDMVLLKVSPWKGAMRFGKRRKLSPRYIGPFRIIASVGPIAYTLELPEELKGIHSTFHVLNLKKCLAEGDIVVPMDEIQLDDKLHMIEEPVEVVDREVKRLKQSRIHIVKVRWNSQRGPEFT